MNAGSDEEAIEELADIVELIHSLGGIHVSTFDEIEKVRLEKAKNRGRFEKKIYLVEVCDEL
ncbi:hypothetical protein [Sporosarcina cyprini]|uniref:hypothetical protein n=1 Tax=Sporosarcina cyprini TaxID=2910523 RepID=UPI00300C73E9